MKLTFIVDQHAVGSMEEEGIRKLPAESIWLTGESLEGFDDTANLAVKQLPWFHNGGEAAAARVSASRPTVT